MRKDDDQRPENKRSFPGLLLIFIVGMIVILAFQNFGESKAANVSFSYQVEQLVNLDLINPEESRKTAGSDNLVNFSGQFRETLTENARDRYRFLSLLSQHYSLDVSQHELSLKLDDLEKQVRDAATYFLQISSYPIGSGYVVIPHKLSTGYRQNGIVIRSLPTDQSLISLSQVKALYQEALSNPTPQNMDKLSLALEELIAEFRSPRLGIGSESQKRILRESELMVSSLNKSGQMSAAEKLAGFEKAIHNVDGIVTDLVREHQDIGLYDLRAVRNQLEAIDQHNKVASEYAKNTAQLDKVRAKIATTTWFFNNQEVTTKGLESKNREEFQQWYAGIESAWTGFNDNKGLYFRAVDQPRTLALEKTFKSEEPAPNYFGYLFTFLPIILVAFLLYFVFSRQMKGVGSSAMNFGKSPAKQLGQGLQKVTFSDVAGIDEAKEELEEIVDFLKDSQKYTKLGAKIPKGVLLIGAPGTGKTLIAKAVAGEAGVPFFSISGSDFVEMFVGVGASRVRDLFDQARKSAPCIIFIDEIDAVGRHRGSGLGGGHDEREQTLNQLLVEMDGMSPSSGVIMIAATNRPDVLDKALLRPGRFDRSVMVNLPDFVGRLAICKVHIKRIKVAPDVDLKALAAQTSGCSGADLANTLNEAALFAAKKRRPAVTQEDLIYACEKVLFGKERKSFQMEDDDKKITAWHEGGHAIVSLVLGSTDELVKITCIPRGQSLGHARYQPKKQRVNYLKAELTTQLAIAMGGRAAEILRSNNASSGAQSDIKQATSIARAMVCEWGMSETLGMINFTEGSEQSLMAGFHEKGYSEETARIIDKEIKKLLDDAYNTAEKILKDNYDKLKMVAEMLLQFETLEREDLDRIMAGTFDAKEKQEKVDAFEGSKKVPPPPVPQTLLDKYKKNFKKGGGNLTDHPGHA